MATPSTAGTASPFLTDLRLAMDPSQEKVVSEALKESKELFKADNERILETLADKISNSIGSDKQSSLSVLRCLRFLGLALIVRDKISSDTFFETVKEISSPEEGGLRPEEEQPLRSLLQLITAHEVTVKKAFAEGQAIRGVLPMYRDLQATVELRSTRPIFEEKEEWTQSRNSLVPIASLRLSLDSGEPNAFCFQATAEDLLDLQERISKILSALKSFE